jgi:phosphoglycerol transferase MdoB-like AlkP superfamily enzyme
LAELQQQYQLAGWHTATTLSESPTWGGGSWMAYTSALFGLRIDTHPQYLALLEKYQTDTYPDLGHFLKDQGYAYVQVSSLSKELNETEQQQHQNFYRMDQWLRYSDLDYNGPQYGWGPAPPDQYVLNFAHKTVVENTGKPVFLFFITQNSHFPWVPLPELLADWQDFNLIEDKPAPPSIAPPHNIKRQNYFKAINYELRFLTDHILRTGDDESIFILIGDHQPQQVSRRSDSFDTPIHIISQDAGLVDAFVDFGFGRGLTVQTVGEPTATMRHEGIYSMLVRVLVDQYGQGNKSLPPYLPEGIPLEQNFYLEEHFNPE